MSITINKININELDQFYDLGNQIRNRNCAFELPWSEEQNIDYFVKSNRVKYQLILGNTSNSSGRLMAYQFESNLEKGYIGWYECDPHDELAFKLLKEASIWLSSLGVKSIEGPMNGSSWGSFRFNTTSDKPLFVTEPYQPLYYLDHWKKSGFVEDVIYETHIVPKTISRPMPKWQVKIFAFVRRIRIKTWPKDLIQNEKKMKAMHNFFHECFSQNQLYQNITFERYKMISKKLQEIIDFENSYLVTDKKENPVSVLISYKDVYHKLYKKGKLKSEDHSTYTLYMKTIATAKAWRGKYISRVLVNFGLIQAYKNGYSEVVFGTMMANNNSAKYSKAFFDAKALRTYAFMKKKV